MKDQNNTTLFHSLEGSSDVYVSVADEMNPSRRPHMEDRHIIHAAGEWPIEGGALKDSAYLGVYDGHGGRDMVDFLEHSLSRHLAQELLLEDETISTQKRLERAFLVTDIHAQHAGISSSGATVACCIIKRLSSTQLRVTAANAGDARIVLGRTIDETVKPLRLTHDHNTHDENEVHRIEQAGGFVLKQRVMGILAITRSLGDHQLKPYVIATPYMQDVTISLEDDPFLIVACDGFWDVCTDQQAVDLVRFYQNDPSFHNGKTVADFLVDEALRRGTSDNVTVIVAFFRAREQS